jgi:hypothetical protein
MNNKVILTIVVAIVLMFGRLTTITAQQVALKTNLLYDATTTPNIGIEMGLGKKSTAQLFYGLNPWKFGSGEDRKFLKHWIVNPEYRYWFCQRFNGSFIGLHAFGGEFDAYKIKMPLGWWEELQDYRFEGWFIGGGLAYGYQWILSRHWNFEAAIGFGAAYIDYDKFDCGVCGKKLDDGHKIYVGPTKAALSLLYMF